MDESRADNSAMEVNRFANPESKKNQSWCEVLYLMTKNVALLGNEDA